MFNWWTQRRWLNQLKTKIIVIAQTQKLTPEQIRRVQVVFTINRADFRYWYQEYSLRQQGVVSSKSINLNSIVMGMTSKINSQLIVIGLEKKKRELFIAACEKVVKDSLPKEREKINGVVDLEDV